MSKMNHPDLSQKKILIVDDIQANALLIDKYLQLANAQTTCLYGGQEALDYLFVEGHHPDVIMLDLKMPEVDGYQVLEAVRKDRRTSDIRVIVVTAFSLEENLTRAMSLGANGYLSKPVSKEDLFDAIFSQDRSAKSDRHVHISEFRKKLFGTGWDTSSHRNLYERVASSFNLTPKKVYMLAHGRSPQSDLESRAFNALIEKGIIQRNRPIRVW